MSIVLAVVWISLFGCISAVAIVWMNTRATSVQRRRHPVDPEQVLAERFARGELDESEYASRLSTLRVGPPLHTYLDR